ncbi:MAG: glycosyltransferase [Vicinamibacteria bacterium]
MGLFLGSSQPYRGLDVILRAVTLLPDRSELPGLIAIAGPDPETIPTHPRIRKLGRIDDVPAVLAGADFLLNANRFSLFDLSNIEAAAAGKPLLLHSVGGNRALERLGAGCRSFEQLTPEALAKALAAMFSATGETLAELGRKSRRCYEEHLTAEAMWHRHLDLYDHAKVRIAV